MSPSDFVSNYFNLVRALNIVLAITMFLLTGFRYLKYKERTRLRLLRLGLMGMIFSSAFGAVNLTLRGVDASYPVFFTTVSLIWLIVAYFYDDLPRTIRLQRRDLSDGDPLDDR
jgi:hypothetical protein